MDHISHLYGMYVPAVCDQQAPQPYGSAAPDQELRVRVPRVGQDELEGWISELASIERPSASEGERRAAEWIVAQLQRAGVDTRIEVERANGTHLPFAVPSLVGLVPG